MNNQTKQIIPDSQAVIQCFDKDTLETDRSPLDDIRASSIESN